MNWNNLLKSFSELSTKDMELAAIWLDRSLVVGNGERRRRIAPGDEVRVSEFLGLCDCTTEDRPTHRITGCYGTIYSTQMVFTLINLSNNEPSILPMS